MDHSPFINIRFWPRNLGVDMNNNRKYFLLKNKKKLYFEYVPDYNHLLEIPSFRTISKALIFMSSSKRKTWTDTRRPFICDAHEK